MKILFQHQKKENMLENSSNKLKNIIGFVMRIFNLIKLNKKNQSKKINELENRITILELRINAILKISESLNGK